MIINTKRINPFPSLLEEIKNRIKNPLDIPWYLLKIDIKIERPWYEFICPKHEPKNHYKMNKIKPIFWKVQLISRMYRCKAGTYWIYTGQCEGCLVGFWLINKR